MMLFLGTSPRCKRSPPPRLWITISPMATLTSCHLMDPICASLLGNATEHLYQLNHVHVTLPIKETSIKTKNDRLFARLDVWDATKKISVAFRSKAMLQLASLKMALLQSTHAETFLL